MSFSLSFARGKIDLYPLCYSSQKSLSSLCDWCLSFYHHSENGNLHFLQRRGFNIVKAVLIVYNKTQWHIFSASRLTTSSSFVPVFPLCEKTVRKAFWYAGRYKQTKTRSSALSPLCWRHKVQSCQKYLTSISARLQCKTRKWRRRSGYRSNACSNKRRRQAQHTIKNNVA